MRPYTIDYLSGDTEPGKEDIFELVGILVHAGTAESGHYYSFIRERPSQNGDESWIEFNDDNVMTWDPSMMEHSTFGGPDYRASFDNNSSPYDKQFSAYMLFYQRASALEMEGEGLIQVQKPGPVRLPMPEALADHIRSENTVLLRRYAMYDPWHVKFVGKVLQASRTFNGGICSSDHELESLALQTTLGHLDQVVSRTKDIPDFMSHRAILEQVCGSCAECSFALYQYFDDRHEAFRALVQRNPDSRVRLETGRLFIQAIQKIKDAFPDRYGITEMTGAESDISDQDFATRRPVIDGVLNMFETLWASFHITLRAWSEHFGLLLLFAQMGDFESALLLAEDYLLRITRILWADPSMELPSNYGRMLSNLIRRTPARQPIYDTIIRLIDHLMGKLDERLDPRRVITNPALRLQLLLHDDGGKKLPWTQGEIQTISQEWNGISSIFVDRLIGLNQEPDYTDNIIGRLIRFSERMEVKISNTIRANINGQIAHHINAPYLRAALVYRNYSEHGERIRRMVLYVGAQCKNLQNAEGISFLSFLMAVIKNPEELGDDELSYSIYQLGLDSIGRWAPGLLGHYEPHVRDTAFRFLHSLLFTFGPGYPFPDESGGSGRTDLVDSAAKQLGLSCLVYLRDNYVSERVPVARDSVAELQRAVTYCAIFVTEEDIEFAELSNSK
jgi:ubiquitin carboxyl-terminal hydrolase 34